MCVGDEWSENLDDRALEVTRGQWLVRTVSIVAKSETGNETEIRVRNKILSLGRRPAVGMWNWLETARRPRFLKNEKIKNTHESRARVVRSSAAREMELPQAIDIYFWCDIAINFITAMHITDEELDQVAHESAHVGPTRRTERPA